MPKLGHKTVVGCHVYAKNQFISCTRCDDLKKERMKYDGLPWLKCGSLTTTASLSPAVSSLATTAKTTASLMALKVIKLWK